MVKNKPIITNINIYGNITKNQDILEYPLLHNLFNIKVHPSIYITLKTK